MNHLETLNNRQKEAVFHTIGPLLILAGAGAGKTRTIAHRILHLVKNGVDPKNILAITFTNKAAKEMRDRINNLIKNDSGLNRPVSIDSLPFVSTFHSLGVHILRENSRLASINSKFLIFDRSDSKRAVKEASEKAGFDPKQFEPAKILSSISWNKGEGLTLNEFRQSSDKNFWKRLVATVWDKYDMILKEENALDFDDLLLKTVKLLANNHEIRDHYANRWNHIHIDEYQDTNKVQYELMRLLSEKNRNLCVVGDIDQMIYSWRGARIDNILNFEKDFPDAKLVVLEENYRSTKVILEAANEIIKKNIKRKEKNLFTKNTGGANISVYSAYDESDEANYVSQAVKSLLAAGTTHNEIAVLFRANFQSRVLEEAFVSSEIPYQVIGTRFYERKEVKDVLSFIRAALNENSLGDLKRIVNVPPRGIGKVTLLKIFEKKDIAGAVGEKVRSFFNLLEKIKDLASTNKTSDTIKFVLKASGLEAHLKTGTEEDIERLENVKELATLSIRYDNMAPPEGIEKLLEDAALAADQDELEDSDQKQKVKLMTVHASKGLEFEHVFIIGLEDGLFPHQPLDNNEDRDEEEERRLFYVALTRAKKKVHLSYASVRTIFGSRQVNLPSEFVTDIPDRLMEAAEMPNSIKTIYF